MIDIEREELVTLAQAAKFYPNRRGGWGVDPATIWRHTTKGVRGERLDFLMCGGTRMTSREAVLRFFAAVTAAVNGDRIEAKMDIGADDQAERFLKANGA